MTKRKPRECKTPTCYDLFDPVFRAPILLMVGGTKKEAFDNLCHRSSFVAPPTQMSYDPDGTCFEIPEKKTFGIYLREFSFDATHIATLAHECLHATNAILNHSGVAPQSSDNDEAYTYHFQWLLTECLNCLVPTKRRKR
jgi:hypothetical protein